MHPLFGIFVVVSYNGKSLQHIRFVNRFVRNSYVGKVGTSAPPSRVQKPSPIYSVNFISLIHCVSTSTLHPYFGVTCNPFA